MDTSVRPILSIVMPVYNEEEGIESVLEEIYSAILSKLPGSELLAIDDGSQDRTPAILSRLSKLHPQIVPYRKKNGGHGDAVLYGLWRARGEYIFLTDSDGQTDPHDFWRLWQRRHESDFVTGVRAERHDPRHRLWIAWLLRRMIAVLFGVKCRDANIPFKLMSSGFWERIKGHIPMDTLTPSLFICLAAKRALNGVIELDVRHMARETGECTIRYMRLFRLCRKAFYQFLRFRFVEWNSIENYSQQSAPSRTFGTE